jgi:hypothetical protein
MGFAHQDHCRFVTFWAASGLQPSLAVGKGPIEVNEHPQLSVQLIRRCEAREFSESDFCPASVRDPEEMFAERRRFLKSVENEHVRTLLRSVLGDPATASAFKQALPFLTSCQWQKR